MARLSVVKREELWDRWDAGESQRSIGRRLGRSPSTPRAGLDLTRFGGQPDSGYAPCGKETSMGRP
jgi:hypothetical protein